ncbi:MULTISPECIES: sensor histidine kinase [Halocynthiibacter]|uniref:histidine kinase n=1 Tax=Halocynthiibacter halioticoli TaxID=2986804 RepID=A0AAE3LPS6_9RHOB|nr:MULTISPECIES: sensor histidine kinase [Halocynthiibacter]MCV6823752.1 sensor histidine kinase [Halocynthiibacter halioticoli]MCW4056753.1 sensor histidine kinase [Halocynthiibacter sp. SDUM655004]
MKRRSYRTSIRRRLLLQLFTMAALLSLAFFLVVRAVAERAAADTQDNILLASATSIADAIYSEQGAVAVDLPYSALSMLGSISEDRVFYRVLIGEETLTGYDDLPLPSPAQGEFETFMFRGEEVRSATVTRTVSSGGSKERATVIVAQTRLGLAAISQRISGMAAVVGFGFLLVATALSLVAAQSALAPLNRMTQSVARRGPDDLRPVDTQTPSELVPLVDALNSFMARLKASLTQSEEFIAEAAHRVRTPLATVRAQAQMTLRRSEKPENKASLRAMIRAVDESSRSAGQLLDHAMVSLRTDQLQDEVFDLVELTQDTVAHLRPTADLKDIAISVELYVETLPIRGDEILMQNALRNVLDNAIKYSPEDSDITVRITEEPRISFVDQGRGFSADDLGDITKRFSRGANVGDIVGSGLGLTIADEVMRAHGGTLEIAPNEEGRGSCVSLVYPRD